MAKGKQDPKETTREVAARTGKPVHEEHDGPNGTTIKKVTHPDGREEVTVETKSSSEKKKPVESNPSNDA